MTTTSRAMCLNRISMIRKVAGIAVNCLEQHGAPKRGDAPFPEKN